jgi:dihydrolipoamide dehydrogenase
MTTTDVLVLGGGPGGYVAAIRAAQLGRTTVCVEMDRTLGGTCVNIGCIPSKALLTSSEHYDFIARHAAEHGIGVSTPVLDLAQMQRRKTEIVGQNTRGIEYLFRKHGITWARGRGTLKGKGVVDVLAPDGTTTTYAAADIIIATGSVPVGLPFLPFDEERVLSNTGALALAEVPSHLVVIGGGVIGLELGSVWRRLGARVTVLELLPTILPEFDAAIIKAADKVFRAQGLDLRTGARVTAAHRDGTRVTVEYAREGSPPERIEADAVLVAIGRRPSRTGVDAAALGLAVGPRGEIVVDAAMRTNLPHVYAIGDVVGGKLLAHKAEEEGIVAAEAIAGLPAHMHYASIPSVVYTWPEIASVGATEEELRAAGRAFRSGSFPFSANARARTLGDVTGFVKILADPESDELLGVHMIGPSVSELIAEIVLAFEYRGSADDVGGTVHAHPSLSEATKEAALAALGRAIHI